MKEVDMVVDNRGQKGNNLPIKSIIKFLDTFQSSTHSKYVKNRKCKVKPARSMASLDLLG